MQVFHHPNTPVSTQRLGADLLSVDESRMRVRGAQICMLSWHELHPIALDSFGLDRVFDMPVVIMIRLEHFAGACTTLITS